MCLSLNVKGNQIYHFVIEFILKKLVLSVLKTDMAEGCVIWQSLILQKTDFMIVMLHERKIKWF